MGADCKSVGLCLRRFESYICHTQNPGEHQLTGVLSLGYLWFGLSAIVPGSA